VAEQIGAVLNIADAAEILDPADMVGNLRTTGDSY